MIDLDALDKRIKGWGYHDLERLIAELRASRKVVEAVKYLIVNAATRYEGFEFVSWYDETIAALAELEALK